MANVTIKISDGDSYERDHEIVTALDGSYILTVVPGAVTVQSIVPKGYSTTNSADNFHYFDISSNQNNKNISFGYIPTVND